MRLEVNLKYYKVTWDEGGEYRVAHLIVGQSASHVREVVKQAFPYAMAIKVVEVIA